MRIHKDQIELLAILVSLISISAFVFYFRQIKETAGAIFGILWELICNRKEQKSGGGPACGDEP